MLHLTRPHLPAPRDPDTAEQRTARNLTTCQELIDLGMMLARAAAERAVSDIHTAPPLCPPTYSMAAEIERAEARARANEPDYCQAFTQISRSVRQTILLETRLAEGRAVQPRTEPAPREAGVSTTQTPTRDAGRAPRETLYQEADEDLDDPFDPSAPLDPATANPFLQSLAATYIDAAPVLIAHKTSDIPAAAAHAPPRPRPKLIAEKPRRSG